MTQKDRLNRSPLRRSLLRFTIAFVVVICLALAVFGFQIYRNDMVARYQNYAGDAIDFIARCIDADDLEQCMRTGVKSEKYHALQALANDFKETHDLVFLYIIKPLRLDPPDNMMDVFAAYTSWGKADGTDGLTDLGNLTGDAYPPDVAAQYMARMDRNPQITYFRNDTDFGNIYTAIRPLFNSAGEPIAVICGDILIDDIYGAAFRYAGMAGLTTLIFAVIVLLLMNWWFGRRIVLPISKLQVAAELFEEKCRRRAAVDELTMKNPDIHTGDEIEALSRTVVSMVQDVQDYARSLLEKDNEISSMREYVNRMDVLAYRDALTGAGNKAAYEKAAKRLDWEILTGNPRFALIMSDLNFLKRINDTYGHDRGNEYLQKNYTLIKQVFRASPVFRIGGDEFLIIAQDEELEHCPECIEKARELMRLSREDKSLEPWEQISSAFGCAVYQKGEDKDTEAVFRRADAEMYADKKQMHAERV